MVSLKGQEISHFFWALSGGRNRVEMGAKWVQNGGRIGRNRGRFGSFSASYQPLGREAKSALFL